MRNFAWNRFPIKNLLIDSLLTPIVESTVHTWIEICASLNHRKKTKADGSRLIPGKHTETLMLLSIVQEVCETQGRWAAPHANFQCAWYCVWTIKPRNVCTFPFMCLTAIPCFLVYHKYLFLLAHYHALNYVPTLQANKSTDAKVSFEQTQWKDCRRLLIIKLLLVYKNFMIHCLFVNVSSAKALFNTNRTKQIYPVPFFSLYFENTSMHIQLLTSFG